MENGSGGRRENRARTRVLGSRRLGQQGRLLPEPSEALEGPPKPLPRAGPFWKGSGRVCELCGPCRVNGLGTFQLKAGNCFSERKLFLDLLSYAVT